MKKYNIAIVGATGAVGKEMIRCLEDLKISVGTLKLGASSKSAGTKVNTFFGNLIIEEVNDKFFDDVDYALFSAGGDNSKKFASMANKKGVIVIDNSSAFRYDDNIPLVVPHVNPEEVAGAKLIANPNCTTAIAVVALYPIYKKYGLKKIIMSTYQATSGAGAKGMQELLNNTKKYIDNLNCHSELVSESLKSKNTINDSEINSKGQVNVFSHNIAFNLIPHIDNFQENGYTKEEMKVTWETHKIFGDSSIDISCSAVRIPTLRAHSESIVLETKKEVDIKEVKNLLKNAPGVELKDDIENNIYPMPLTATGKYNVEVGRIRKSLIFGKYGIEFFISGDQLLRGAALNAVEILKIAIESN